MDEETVKQIEKAVAERFATEGAKLKEELAAQYSVKAHWLREWITAHPLPAARISLVVGGVAFSGALWGAQALWSLVRH